MSGCSNKYTYKLLEKDTYIIKNNKQQLQSPHGIRNSNKSVNTAINNAYSAKSYSSIKSLIRRLEAVGYTKINYPKVKQKNERNDIFLQGGAINNIKHINFLDYQQKSPNFQNSLSKQPIKKSLKFHQRPQQINEVFICKKKHSTPQYNQINRVYSTVKTQTPHKQSDHQFTSNFTKQSNYDSRTFSSIDVKYRDQLLEDLSISSNLQTLKNPQKELIQIKQTQKTEDSTNVLDRKAMLVQSENQIRKGNLKSRQTDKQRFFKISKPLLLPESKFANKAEIPLVTDFGKPLFYLSQQQLKDLKISCKNFIVTEHPSGQIVAGSYYKQIGEIASLTKIITFYCILSLVEKFNIDIDSEIIQIDQQIQAVTGTSAELIEGDQIALKQICYGLMLPSGNDAALALAKWGGKMLKISQDEDCLKVFLKYMNEKCLQIGMKSSFFGNPHGLPHLKSGTTAQDVAIVINKALNIPFFREIIKTKIYKCWVFNSGAKRQIIWENTQKLLRRNGFIGVKTGVTVTAGPCLATCYELGQKIYIIIILKASKLSRRFKQTRRILGKVLLKLYPDKYRQQINSILKNDIQLDSDNSQDQQEFNYDRADPQQMKKRAKILTYQM